MSVLAADDVTQTAAATLSTGGSGTLDVEATSGSIVMHQDAISRTDGQNIRYWAGLDVVIGIIDARTDVDRLAGALSDQSNWGDISINAIGGSIIDPGPTISSETEVYASSLRMFAHVSIGYTPSPLFRIDTEVIHISAIVEIGGIFYREATGLDGNSAIGLVPVNRVLSDGTTIVEQDAGTQRGTGRI